jgi:hypothetical protein
VSKQKFVDPRNNKVTVFDLAGAPHQATMTNARELVRHSNWTLDAAVATTRRVKPESAPPSSLDLSVQTRTKPVKPTAVFEDLVSIGKADLRKAATVMGITEGVDGRTSDKRLVVIIESALDQRLIDAGDFNGPETLPAEPAPTAEQITVQHEAAVARRRRAFGLEAKRLEIAFTDETSLVGFLTTLAGRIVDTGSVANPATITETEGDA